VDLSGSGGATTAGTSTMGSAAGAGAGSGADSGTVAHAESTSNKETAASCRSGVDLLITETNTKHVDLGRAQPTAQHVQLVKIVRRANIYSMVITIVHLNALDVGFDTM